MAEKSPGLKEKSHNLGEVISKLSFYVVSNVEPAASDDVVIMSIEMSKQMSGKNVLHGDEKNCQFMMSQNYVYLSLLIRLRFRLLLPWKQLQLPREKLLLLPQREARAFQALCRI